MTDIKYWFKSIKGTKSDDNEDSISLPEDYPDLNIVPDVNQNGYLFVLCDGMGGHLAGEVASQLCSTWYNKEYYQKYDNNESIYSWLIKEANVLNKKLYTLSCGTPEYYGMGTTLVVFLIKDGVAYFTNVGDSRLYLIRDGKIKQLTEDDSEVWNLFRKGLISKNEILTHPRNNIVTQAVGTKNEIKPHNYEPLVVKDEDKFLLCSDGLTDKVTDTQILSIINNSAREDKGIDALVELAKVNGSIDDISIILIKA